MEDDTLHDEVIELYFGDIVPQTELERRVMKNFALAFELTHLPEEERPNNARIIKHITDGCSTAEIFSTDCISHLRMVDKVRKQLQRIGIKPDPEVPRNERIIVKLAHMIYPGESNKANREEAVELCRAFLNGLMDRARSSTPEEPAASTANTNFPQVAPTPSTNHGNIPVGFTQGTVPGFYSRPIQHSEYTPVQYRHFAGIDGQVYSAPTEPRLFQNQISMLMQQNAQLQAQLASIMNNRNRTEQPNSEQVHGSFPRNSTPLNIPVSFGPEVCHGQPDNQDHRHGNNRSSNGNSNAHHHIGIRFKSKESKYSGSDEENLTEFINLYVAACEDHGLRDDQMKQYLHNLFRGRALSFYNSKVKRGAQTFDQAIRMIHGYFNSPDVQYRVKTELSKLKLKTFSEKHGSDRKGLCFLAAHISDRISQCPPHCQGESNQVDFLRNAVLGQPWAKEILRDIKPSTEFQTLYTDLAKSLQVHEEEAESKGVIADVPKTDSSKRKPLIFFTQPRYVKSMAKSIFPGNEEARSCWNCGRKGHRFTKCHKNLDMAQIASRKADYLSKKKNGTHNAKRVLYELVSGLNELCDLGSHDSRLIPTFFGDLNEDSDDDTSSSSHTSEEEAATDTKASYYNNSKDVKVSQNESDQDF